MNAVTQSASVRGTYLKRPANSIKGLETLHHRVVSSIIEAAADLRAGNAADCLRTEGLEALHTVIGPNDIGALRDKVLEALRHDLLSMAVTVGQSVMQWPEEFFVDDYLILRINLPYSIAKKADPAAENPGIGRVSPQIRETAAQRRVKDPVYDPKAYHRNHPPAAWAHGPHVDSWSGHSRDGLNIWWAICDVPAEAGMVLYPEMADQSTACDPKTLYLASGHRLPAPTFVPLQAGEMLIFDPEILHGTHLNITDRTRVAISMRLNASKPTFDPGCFYAREFWRRSSDIDAGNFDRVMHFKREDNLGPPSLVPGAPRAIGEIAPSTDEGHAVFLSSMIQDGDRLIANVAGQRILLARVNGTVHAVDAACPHYGLDLIDGGCAGNRIYCPGCAVGFNLESGRSGSDDLVLKTFPVQETNGTIVLQLSAERV